VTQTETDTQPAPAAPATPFHDLEAYMALPRVGELALSPDGTRLVTTVATLNPKRTKYVTALWDVDPAGERPARRLTRSAKGEGGPVFTAGGDVLFVSARPDPDEKEPKDDAPAALWLLPAGGGEARVVGTRPGGIDGVAAAARADTVVVLSKTMPGAVTAEDDEERRTARKDRAVSAILHTGYPVRYWDEDLGPDQPRLLAGTAPGDGDGTIEWRDLTPEPRAALFESAPDVAPDGSAVVTAWAVAGPCGETHEIVVRIDAETGERTSLLEDARYYFHEPRISPDGARVAALRRLRSAPDRPPQVDVVVVGIDGGEPEVVAGDWDRWADELRWTPDGEALIVMADENGRAPLFRIGVADGSVVRLTGDDAAYTNPCVSPDGRFVYALRNAIGAPPAPVRLDAHAADQEPALLAGPAPAPALPGTVTEITGTAEDGTDLRAWLVLPDGADADAPAPLLLWVHGGPLSTFNAWTWRWSAWLMAARGYAVLLPDPALSTGYGQHMVDRGWAKWGGPPFTDVMALTDVAEARPEIDASRTAAMGGSFGGYMANWIAGHTDRFRAIVTHASLWALDQFGPTTDDASYWLGEMTEEMALENSPHLHADGITTPMLVIHGDKDYRVPIGEALRLWWDLVFRQRDPDSNPHRFLYFPDENHWILTPQNAIVWYETVFAFLAEHVLGEEGRYPDVLR
jgi:dipeptidyl aminopeptidase/acylaminoacyl peptidase